MNHILRSMIVLALTASVGACACRPPAVGPYGGVNPGRCWVW